MQLNENPSGTFQIVDNHLDSLEDQLRPLDNPACVNDGFRRVERNCQVKFLRILGSSNIILNARGAASISNIFFNPKIRSKIFDYTKATEGNQTSIAEALSGIALTQGRYDLSRVQILKTYDIVFAQILACLHFN